eukprot:CFRG1528T1
MTASSFVIGRGGIAVAVGVALGALSMAAFDAWLNRFIEDGEDPIQHINSIISKISEKYNIPSEILLKARNKFSHALELGLRSHDTGEELKIVDTFASSGTGLRRLESGTYMVLDIGTGSFNLGLATLTNNREVTLKRQKRFAVPDMFKSGKAKNLFGLYARCIADHFSEFVDSEEPLIPIGVSFPQPYKQTDRSRGIILGWTKGYDIPDAIGSDFNSLLTVELQCKGVHNPIVALVHDTTSTFANARLKGNKCRIGVVVGRNGTNACYLERLTDAYNQTKVKLVTAQWSDYKVSKSVPLLEEELQLIGSAENQYDIITCGHTVTRLIADEWSQLIITNQIEIETQSIDPLANLCLENIKTIVSDYTAILWKTERLLSERFGIRCGMWTRILLKQLCEIVLKRSAEMACMGISALVLRSQDNGECSIALHGGLVMVPGYLAYLDSALTVACPGVKIFYDIHERKDVSCTSLGTAVCAAAAVANNLTGNQSRSKWA